MVAGLLWPRLPVRKHRSENKRSRCRRRPDVGDGAYCGYSRSQEGRLQRNQQIFRAKGSEGGCEDEPCAEATRRQSSATEHDAGVGPPTFRKLRSCYWMSASGSNGEELNL